MRCCSGDGGNIGYTQPFSKTFVVAEDKDFVLLDRSTQSKAELISLKGRRIAAHGGIRRICVEKVASIQSAVAVKLKDGAMKLVGAAFGGDVDHAS